MKGGEFVLSDGVTSQGHERPDIAALSGKRLALGWVSKFSSGANEIRLRILSETKLAAMAAVPSCRQPVSGMVFWTPFDDSADDVVAGNTPSLYGATIDASVPAGRSGRSLKVSKGGSAVYGASVGGKQPFHFATGDFSVEMWVKLAGDQQNAPIVSTIEAAQPGPFVSGPVPPGMALSTVNGKLAFSMSNGQSNSQWAAPQYLADDRWHHIAVSVDREVGNGGQVFVDGKISLAFDPRSLQGPIVSVAPLIVGNDPQNNRGTAITVDEMVIYHHALSAGEVSESVSKQMCRM